MKDHRPHLRLVDDPVSETLVLLDGLSFPLMMLVLLVVAKRAEQEGTLTPAERIWLLRLIQHALFVPAERAA